MVRQAGSEGHKSRFLQLTDVAKGRDKDDAAQDLSDQAPASHRIPVRSSQPSICACSSVVAQRAALNSMASSAAASVQA